MLTSSAKGKGRALQQHVCRTLTEIFEWDEGDAESRSMGSQGVDVILSPRARRDFPFSIECKNTKIKPTTKAHKQAAYNKYKNTLPGVVWKPHGKPFSDSVITFNLAEFAAFYKGIITHNNECKEALNAYCKTQSDLI